MYLTITYLYILCNLSYFLDFPTRTTTLSKEYNILHKYFSLGT